MLDMLTLEEVREHTATIRQHHGFIELYEESYAPVQYNLDDLASLPEDSLAHNYMLFMKKHGYKADWYPVRHAPGELTYMRNRLYQTHDIIHTITGFDGSQFGEIGVQAFYLGQMPEQPLPCAIMSSGFLRAMSLTAWDRDALMHALHQGYEMGRKARPVLFRKWEHDWAEDISKLRADVGIEATDSHIFEHAGQVGIPFRQ